ADPSPPPDPDLEFHRARRRALDPGDAANLLRPVAAAPRAARGFFDPVGRKDAHRPGFPDRDPAADRGNQPAARPQRGTGGGGAASFRQPRPTVEDSVQDER